ncbi:MAG: DnaD domain protein [Clostridia bacterium]|nr:DnaD domain protein [Clostridia bacterium]
MNGYKINPAAYTGVTVLPSAIVEQHLKLAGLAQLKAVLCAFADPGKPLSPEEAAERCGLSPEEAADALEYWRGKGLLLAEDERPATEEPAPAEPEKEPDKPARVYAEAKPTRLRRDQIAARLVESPEVGFLFTEAQARLGRTIGDGDQSSLLLLHDYYGLPVEVILAICEYARTHGKANNMSYIYTVGLDWSKREIDTIERADEELRHLESVHSRWGEFCDATGLRKGKPTAAQAKLFAVWLDEWHFPMSVIALAYEEMSKNTEKVSFPYINKVLANWHMHGVQTPEAVADEQKRFAEKQEQAAAQKSKGYNAKAKPAEEYAQPASYDIARAEQKAKTSVPKLVKKGKR